MLYYSCVRAQKVVTVSHHEGVEVQLTIKTFFIELS